MCKTFFLCLFETKMCMLSLCRTFWATFVFWQCHTHTVAFFWCGSNVELEIYPTEVKKRGWKSQILTIISWIVHAKFVTQSRGQKTKAPFCVLFAGFAEMCCSDCNVGWSLLITFFARSIKSNDKIREWTSQRKINAILKWHKSLKSVLIWCEIMHVIQKKISLWTKHHSTDVSLRSAAFPR